LKMTPRSDGSLLLLWELWASSSYVATKAMTVAANGTVINAETDLSSLVRLGRRDDPFRLNDGVYLVAGNKADPALELIVIEPASASTQPQLTIIRSGANGILTWPTSATGFNLRSTTNLVSPVWIANPPTPVVVNGQNTV